MPSRNVFQTKTFWINLAVVVVIYAWNQFAPDHQINQGSSLITWMITAIGARTATNGPAHLLPKA